MPTSLATLLTIAFVIFAIAMDTRRQQISGAVWLPVMWAVIVASRFPSQWLQLGSPLVTNSATTAEGSPLDAAYFASLIVIGLVVLARRKLDAARLVQMNLLLTIFFVYGALSILWSDFPFVAFKRWVKTLGHPVMALIILTDPNPGLAFRALMKRCAFVLLPVSVLFIKYLPEYGRGFDQWSGAPSNSGVGNTKNGLGYICMTFGIFSIWTLLCRDEEDSSRARRLEVMLALVTLSMVLWLLAMADSATSLAGLIVGSATLLMLRFSPTARKYIGTLVFGGLIAVLLIDWAFDAYDKVIAALGRDTSLTDRTEVWADVLALQDRPVLGMGFESFWLGSRLEAMWQKWWWRPNQAHNGYIETYLNLGLVGIGLLAALLVSTFAKIKARVSDKFGFADLRLAFFFVILAFNYTEAGFKAVHLMWTMFHLIAIDYLSRQSELAAERGPAQASRKYVRRRRSWRRQPVR